MSPIRLATRSFLAFLGLALALSTVSAARASEPSVTELTFGTHLQAGLPEQDVFVASAANHDEVMRVEGEVDDATRAMPVYAAAEAVEHDPFKMGSHPLGPFPMGDKLGFTLGSWLAATGKGRMTVDGDSAMLDFSFDKLVPDAVYTIWCTRASMPPNVTLVDKPCGAADGSDNSFKSDAGGHGSFSVHMDRLPDVTMDKTNIIALAYHSDGKTYGPNAGDFGLHTHVQLAWIMPMGEAAAPAAGTETTSTEPTTTEMSATEGTATEPTPEANALPTTGIGDTFLESPWLVGMLALLLALIGLAGRSYSLKQAPVDAED